MIFELTEDQTMVREMVRRFATDVVLPEAHGWSEAGELPTDIFHQLHSVGLTAATTPLVDGGSELDPVSFALALEELGRADGALGIVVASHDAALSISPVRAEMIANGEVSSVVTAGLVTGTKYVDRIVTTVGVFDLEKFTPLETQGMRAAGISRVDVDGEAPETWKTWNAAVAVGVMRAALEDARTYATEREQFGKPIAAYQAIQFKIADMATQVDAARLLTLSAAAGQASPSAALGFAADAALFVTDEAVQIHGGYGYSREYPVERYYRDARWFSTVVA